MGQELCRILTDSGEFYTLYDDVIDQFVTPAIQSTDERLDFGTLGDFEPQKVNAHRIFDLRRPACVQIEQLLTKLGAGKTLKVSEACIIARFRDFLQDTVADHQYKYLAVSEKVLESWVQKLGLRKRFPEYPADEIATDLGMHPAFQAKDHRARFKKLGPWPAPTAAQNRIAAKYVQAIANIADVLGPRYTPANEVVDKFFKLMEARDKVA